MQDTTTSEILIPRELSDRFRLWRDIKRTAVLGTDRSGKSVFLTSVIDRLNRLNGKTTKVGTGTLTWHIDRLPPDEGAGGFPLRTYRNDLRAQEWPGKTVALSEYNYRFYYTGDGPATRAIANLKAEERSFLDLPGERLADFSMAQKSYAQWSDALLDTFENRQSCKSLVQDYLQLLNNAAAGSLEEAEVLTAYKKVLARFARRLIPLVSPSTFLVYDHDVRRYPKGGDKPAHEMTVDELVQRGVCGLDATNEFVPLSAAAREDNPELAHRFAARFTAYRDQLAAPLAVGFYTSEELLVLVDVAAILEGGPTVYDGTRQVLERMLEYLDPGRSMSQVLSDLAKKVTNIGAEVIDQLNRYLPSFLRLNATRPPNVSRVSKVGFIATKSDCVHSRDRANLRTLLRQMTEELLQEAVRERWLSVEYFSCAAIQATRDLDDYPYLAGYEFIETKDEMEYRKMAVSPVPSVWPAESQWEQTQYKFVESRPPKLDLLGNRPFPSLGIEAVMRFIGWDGA